MSHPQRQECPSEARPARTAGHVWTCAAVWATAIFLTLNALLSAWTLGLPGRAPAERGATFVACNTAVDQYSRETPAPQIVLMGSSLVMAPVWSSDVSRYPGVANVYMHHRSLRLAGLLDAAGIKGQHVFSFGLPGAMVSDLFLITEKLFSGERRPQVIILGLAPRDFMDDLLTGETKTAVFQQLMTLSDLPSLGELYLSSWPEKADFVASNAVFLYGKRLRYQDKVASTVKRAYERTMPSPAPGADPAPAAAEGQFLLGQNRKEVWRKSIEEYRARYKHFNAEQFDKQSKFLKALIELAERRGIRVVLVNMPLSRDNLAVMPEGLYNVYMGALTGLADRYHCPLLDLQQDRSFRELCFYDTVHLNNEGGDRLFGTLAAWLRAHSTKLAGLRQP